MSSDVFGENNNGNDNNHNCNGKPKRKGSVKAGIIIVIVITAIIAVSVWFYFYSIEKSRNFAQKALDAGCTVEAFNERGIPTNFNCPPGVELN